MDVLAGISIGGGVVAQVVGVDDIVVWVLTADSVLTRVVGGSTDGIHCTISAW